MISSNCTHHNSFGGSRKLKWGTLKVPLSQDTVQNYFGPKHRGNVVFILCIGTSCMLLLFARIVSAKWVFCVIPRILFLLYPTKMRQCCAAPATAILVVPALSDVTDSWRLASAARTAILSKPRHHLHWVVVAVSYWPPTGCNQYQIVVRFKDFKKRFKIRKGS